MDDALIMFEQMNLTEPIIKAIQNMGFEQPTPIQSQTIPVILDGHDVIGQAQTGTGKTAAFGLPIVQMLSETERNAQALILCPTRELAIQCSEELAQFSKFRPGLRVLPVYGGQSIDRQFKGLKQGPQIIVGTPGRIMDHMERKTLRLDHIKIVVLDEADEMLAMGFRDDIEEILTKTPPSRQTVLFSATLPKGILALTQNYQKNPQLIKVVHKTMSAPNIEQYYLEVKASAKCEVLCRLLDSQTTKLTLVFCNTKRTVDELVEHLLKRGYLAGALHGDMKQGERDRVMDKFRKSDIDVLVATDVAARGIDIDDVTVVVNYDMPQDEEYYVHRIGRTGRAGRSGLAYMFVCGKEYSQLRAIRNYTRHDIERMPIPTMAEVQAQRVAGIFEMVRKSIESSVHQRASEWIESLIAEDYTPTEIAAALLQIQLGDGMTEDSDSVANLADSVSEQGMVRLFINIGKTHRVSVIDLLTAIESTCKVSRKELGKVTLCQSVSFINVPSDRANDIIQSMRNVRIGDVRISMAVARAKER